MSKAREFLNEVLSGPPGKKKKIHKDGLAKKDAIALAKELRAKGVFASVFPSEKSKNKRMVISWE